MYVTMPKIVATQVVVELLWLPHVEAEKMVRRSFALVEHADTASAEKPIDTEKYVGDLLTSRTVYEIW